MRFLFENAKEDKLFYAMMKHMDKFIEQTGVNPTGDSFINCIQRMKEYYEEKEDDELDNSDVQVLSTGFKHQTYIVKLSYKGKTYVTTFYKEDEFKNFKFQFRKCTFCVYILKDSQYNMIYTDNVTANGNAQEYGNMICVELLVGNMKQYAKEKNKNIVYINNIEKLLRENPLDLYELLMEGRRIEGQCGRLNSEKAASLFDKYSDGDLGNIFSMTLNKDTVYNYMVKYFYMWYDYAH